MSPWTRRTGPRADARFEVFRPSADHVVERNDFDTALVAQQIDDVGADESGAAGHQNALPLQMSQRHSPIRLLTGKTSLSKIRYRPTQASARTAFSSSVTTSAHLLRPKFGIDRKREELIGQ